MLVIVNIDWCFIGTVVSTTNTSYYHLWLCVSRSIFFCRMLSFLSPSVSPNLYLSIAHFCRVKLIIWLFLCCLYYLFIPPRHISFVHFCTHFSVLLCSYTSMHFKWMCDANNNNNTELNHNFIPNNYNYYNSSSCVVLYGKKRYRLFEVYLHLLTRSVLRIICLHDSKLHCDRKWQCNIYFYYVSHRRAVYDLCVKCLFVCFVCLVVGVKRNILLLLFFFSFEYDLHYVESVHFGGLMTERESGTHVYQFHWKCPIEFSLHIIVLQR